jgi:hypothetical protein
MARQRYAQLAAAVLVAAFVFAGARAIGAPAWAHFTKLATDVMAWTLVVLWAVTAAALLARPRSATIAVWSWILSVFSVFGLVFRALAAAAFSQELWIALGYAIAAGLTGFFVKRAFDRGLTGPGRGRALHVRHV